MSGAPANGDTITAHIPGRKRPLEYVVIGHVDQFPGAVRAARPSRKHSGDYHRGTWVILPEWIVAS